MYETAGIAPLSQTQVSKLLNHHSVRVKAGTHHKVGLSKAQLKKHSKAQMKGTGYNLTLDPYQVANMQYLRNEIGKAMLARKAIQGGRLLIDEPFTARQAVNTTGDFFKDPKGSIGFGMHGGKINRLNKFNRWTGALGGVVQNIGDFIAPVAKPIFQAGTQRAVGYINGMGAKPRGRPRKSVGGTLLIDQPFTARQAVNTTGDFFKDPKGSIGFGMDGGKINRLRKFNRWTGALGGVAQNIGDFIAPVAKPIFQAGTQRAVSSINGMGVKRRGRPKKGGNLGPAGSSPLIKGRGKKAMHFDL